MIQKLKYPERSQMLNKYMNLIGWKAHCALTAKRREIATICKIASLVSQSGEIQSLIEVFSMVCFKKHSQFSFQKPMKVRSILNFISLCIIF